MPTRSLLRRASALPLAATLLLAGAAVPAAATGADHHTEQIHQQLPIAAGDVGHGDCPTVPAGKDGWHFVLPGDDTVFTELTVTFEPGGEQVVTAFGPPGDKHAYAASAPGAKLVAAVAETEGADVKYFNLSHTCPASGAPGTPGEEQPGEENPGEENPGQEQPGGEQPGEEQPGGEQPGTEETCSAQTDGRGEEPTCEEQAGSGGQGAEPTPDATPQASAEGDLAETGAGTTLGLAFAAALLVAAGGAIVIRDRHAASGG